MKITLSVAREFSRKIILYNLPMLQIKYLLFSSISKEMQYIYYLLP